MRTRCLQLEDAVSSSIAWPGPRWPGARRRCLGFFCPCSGTSVERAHCCCQPASRPRREARTARRQADLKTTQLNQASLEIGGTGGSGRRQRRHAIIGRACCVAGTLPRRRLTPMFYREGRFDPRVKGIGSDWTLIFCGSDRYPIGMETQVRSSGSVGRTGPCASRLSCRTGGRPSQSSWL